MTTTAAAPIKGSQPLNLVGVFFSAGHSIEDGSDEEESDDEEISDEEGEVGGEYKSTSGSHDWRDEFESAFMFSAPLPSHSLHTIFPQPTSSTAQQKQKRMAEERKREKQKFEQGMNDPLPCTGYEVLWEVPPPSTMTDLEFLVERDLDAGWWYHFPLPSYPMGVFMVPPLICRHQNRCPLVLLDSFFGLLTAIAIVTVFIHMDPLHLRA